MDISYHSNQSTYAMAIKNISFVEANMMNNSEMFQLYPQYSFWGTDFWIVFCKFSLLVAMTTNQIDRFGQKVCLVEDHSTNISEKLLSKYLQWDSNKCQFSFFAL